MEHSHRRQPRFQRQRLDSGLLVLVSENDRLPLLSLNAFVVAGADQNPLGRSGLAALTCRLLDEGTEKRTASQIAEAVENAGASLSTFSDRELSGISLDGCAADLEMGLDLVMEMLTSPIFQEDRFL
jgi:predicted Zn-dependent peptidase